MGDLRDESELCELVRSQSFDRAATRILKVYGPELYGFLVTQLPNDADAGDVFSQVAEDLWRGLPTFRLKCSVRTWLYVLTRHAAARYRRSPWNRRDVVGDEHLAAVSTVARTTTKPWRRTDVKERWRRLRETLDPDDRALLTLRLDRQLSWTDVARVTLGKEAPQPRDLVRETGRLRKRFQLLKDELYERARDAGLIERAK